MHIVDDQQHRLHLAPRDDTLAQPREEAYPCCIGGLHGRCPLATEGGEGGLDGGEDVRVAARKQLLASLGVLSAVIGDGEQQGPEGFQRASEATGSGALEGGQAGSFRYPQAHLAGLCRCFGDQAGPPDARLPDDGQRCTRVPGECLHQLLQLVLSADESRAEEPTAMRGRAPVGGQLCEHLLDSVDAAEVFARDRGCPLHTVSVSHADLLEHLPVAVASAEGLCINGQLVARRLLARRVRQEGVVVVLSGEGSDEVALCYPHLALDGGAALGELASVHGPQAGVMLPSGRTVGTAAFERSLGWTPSFLRAKLAFGDRLLCLVDPEFRAAGPDPVDVLADSLEALPLAGHPPAQQASALWMELCLAGYILRGISDAQDMAEGVESRPPFLDPAVWALARCIPARAQLEGGLGKQVLRRALAPRLGSVAARPKHPFLAPPLLGALAGDRALYDGVRGQLQGLVQVPGVDGRAVSSWLEDSVAVPLPGAELAARDAVLWTLMSAAALADSLGEAA